VRLLKWIYSLAWLQILGYIFRPSRAQAAIPAGGCTFTFSKATLRSVTVLGAVLAGALLLARQLGSQTGAETSAGSTVPSRVIRIPLATLAQDKSDAAPTPDDALLVSEGGADELPEGPSGFDVFDDGSFLIADPMRKRLAMFDPKGKFMRELKIGFAADSLTITPGGLIQAREANTGAMHFFDREGQPGKTEEAAPQAAEARLLNEQTGTISRPEGPVKIAFEKPGLRLISIESLAVDQGNTYVALEAAANGEKVDVNKYVRKYSAEGKMVSEVSDLPLDYYVSPVNELRIRKGVLYQLMTTRTEVQINEWDVN
jgi:hypothetical protein